MIWQGLISSNSRAVKTCRIVGLCVFILAFAAPAVTSSAGADGANPPGIQGSKGAGSKKAVTRLSDPGSFRGNQCAGMSLVANLIIVRSPRRDLRDMPSWMFLVAVSAWINPLILIYLAFCLSRRFIAVRIALAAAILVCVVVNWIFFAVAPFVPLIGYFLWLAGILTIVAPDLVRVIPQIISNDEIESVNK